MPSEPREATRLARMLRLPRLGVLNARVADRLGRLALSEATSDGSVILAPGGKTPVALSVAIADAIADSAMEADIEMPAWAMSDAEALAEALAEAEAAAATDSNPDGSSSEKSGRLKDAANDNALLEQKQLTMGSSVGTGQPNLAGNHRTPAGSSCPASVAAGHSSWIL